MADNAEGTVKQREKHVRFLLDEESNVRPQVRYRKTPKKLQQLRKVRSDTEDVCEEIAKNRDALTEIYRRVMRMTEDAEKLKLETRQLVGDYADLGKKFAGLELEKKVFDDKVDKHLDDVDEKRYLDGLINHLNEVDRNMTFEPCQVLGCSIDEGYLQSKCSLSER